MFIAVNINLGVVALPLSWSSPLFLACQCFGGGGQVSHGVEGDAALHLVPQIYGMVVAIGGRVSYGGMGRTAVGFVP